MALVLSKDFNEYLKSQNEKAFAVVKYIESFVWDDYDLLEPERVVSRNKEQLLYDMLNNSKRAQKKFVQLLKDSSNSDSTNSQPNTFSELFQCLKNEYELDAEAQSKLPIDNFEDFDNEFDDDLDKRHSQKVSIQVDARQCEFILDTISTFEDRARQAKYFRPDIKTNETEYDLTSLKRSVEDAMLELTGTKTTSFKSAERKRKLR